VNRAIPRNRESRPIDRSSHYCPRVDVHSAKVCRFRGVKADNHSSIDPKEFLDSSDWTDLYRMTPRRALVISQCCFLFLLLLNSFEGIKTVVVAQEAEKQLKPEIIGHRGASYDAPENTLASFNLAWSQRADAVELDVVLTKDQRLLVMHDKDTKRIGGVDKLVNEQTLDELRQLDAGGWKHERFKGEKFPLLREALATIPDGKRLYIELKCGSEGVADLKREIVHAGKKPEQTIVISFSAEAIAESKRVLPTLTTYLIADIRPNPKTGRVPPTIDELIQQAKKSRADGLDLSAFEAIDANMGNTIRKAGLKLAVWTVNDPTLARKMIDAGVQSLTTDRPGWLRKQLNIGK